MFPFKLKKPPLRGFKSFWIFGLKTETHIYCGIKTEKGKKKETSKKTCNEILDLCHSGIMVVVFRPRGEPVRNVGIDIHC